jgi:OOP family OmpA-OmpF porin
MDMRRTKRIAGSLVALTMLATGVAEAKPEGAGVFFGVGGGQSTYDQDRADYDFIARDAFFDAGLPIVSLQSDLDDSDSTLAVFGGYRFNRYIAVEGGYLNLGEVTYTGNATFRVGFFATAPGTVRVTAGAQGAYVSALGSLPITRFWEVYGRGGFLVEETEVEATATVVGVTASADESTSGVDAILGVGTAFHAGKHVSIRVEYQRFIAVDDDYEEDTAETNANVFNLGVVFRF